MSVRITIELSDNDLSHFRNVMRAARGALGTRPQDEIVAAAQALLEGVRESAASEFLRERFAALADLIDMVGDPDWQIPREERDRVVAALAYFAEESDLIPDSIPGLGYLDDAIMIELVLRDLRHEIEAYADFCRFRDTPAAGQSQDPLALAQRRVALLKRLREDRAGELALF